MRYPDIFYSDLKTRATVYQKAYPFDISPNNMMDPSMTPVSSQSSRIHKVFISPDPTRSTQFPLASRHGELK